LTGIAFTDTLPPGLVVATPNGLSGMCGGMVAASGTAIQLSNGALAGGANCTITLNVKAIADGMQNNTTSTVTSNEGGNGGTATASILVADPPQITKAFGALALPVGSAATVTFTITNPNTNVTLTGINYTDTLPAGLIVATPNGLTNTCGGNASTTANTIVLTGASLATGASCSVTANLAGTHDAVVTNTVTVNSDQGTGNTASAVIAIGDIFSVNYAANLNVGDSFVDFTNSGSSNGANLCVNLYAFDPAEELISCCTCSVTPNGLQTLSIQQSLISNPLTPAAPTAIVIKAIATTGTCNASTPSAANLAPGALAWGTTLHQTIGSAAYQVTERPFSPATLSAAELAHITSTCGYIQSNGSGFGICKGCAAGALDAASTNQ
jgi:fimbrial isopeptide formation D2 family protein